MFYSLLSDSNDYWNRVHQADLIIDTELIILKNIKIKTK